MSNQWGPDEYPYHSKPADYSPVPLHVQRRAHRIFCTIYVAGIYGLVLTFHWPYIWEFIACVGTAILYAWAINAKLAYLPDSGRLS
jgi:hypothetical protein